MWEAQELQFSVMGYLPGFATPRFVDVPFVGKRWVHMTSGYDRVKGITSWRKNYRTGIEYDDAEALERGTRTTIRSSPSQKRDSSIGVSSWPRTRASSSSPSDLPAAQSPGFPIVRRWGHDARKCENDVP